MYACIIITWFIKSVYPDTYTGHAGTHTKVESDDTHKDDGGDEYAQDSS